MRYDFTEYCFDRPTWPRIKYDTLQRNITIYFVSACFFSLFTSKSSTTTNERRANEKQIGGRGGETRIFFSSGNNRSSRSRVTQFVVLSTTLRSSFFFRLIGSYVFVYSVEAFRVCRTHSETLFLNLIIFEIIIIIYIMRALFICSSTIFKYKRPI